MTQPFSIAEVKTLMLQLLRWVEEARKHKLGFTPGAPTVWFYSLVPFWHTCDHAAPLRCPPPMGFQTDAISPPPPAPRAVEWRICTKTG